MSETEAGKLVAINNLVVEAREFVRATGSDETTNADKYITELCDVVQSLQALNAADSSRERVEELQAFKDAVVGWRENDWPEGFCRRTAEMIAENAKRRSEQ